MDSITLAASSVYSRNFHKLSMRKPRIEALIGPLGLRWRVRFLVELAREIAVRKGRIPKEQSQLEALPGVGPYAAAATLSLHSGVRATPIDANIVRVLCRIVDAPWDPETRRRPWIQKLADHLVPEHEHRDFNYALIDIAMTHCTARRPNCGECPLAHLCEIGRRTTSPR